MSRRIVATALLLQLAACADGSTVAPPTSPGVSPVATVDAKKSAEERLFKDYVAMGTSIAAGFMSGGIVAGTQLAAYPALLAEAAGVDYTVRQLAAPGCPPPWSGPFAPSAPSCAGLATSPPVTQVNNVAVPGLTVAEAFVAGSGGQVATLLLGNLSQVEAMRRANPTFVTVHLGDNDVFAAALAGEDDLLTPLASFQASFATIASAVAAAPRLRGAALIGLIDPILGAPALQPGAYFFIARDATGRFQGKVVNDNCSPVNFLGQPNPLAANIVSGAIMLDPAITEINCDPAAYPVGDPRRGAYLLDPTEIASIRASVQAFNATIAAAAAANGWAYVDPNQVVAVALSTRIAGRADLLRKCQDLATATTAAQFQAAVLFTCPVTGPTAAPNFFGAFSSLDGVHPSPVGHEALAALLAAAIDARYGTSLSPL